MKRLIISYEGLTEEQALLRVYGVISHGRISEAKGMQHYCWHTTFKDNSHVSVRTKRNESSADSFIVYR